MKSLVLLLVPATTFAASIHYPRDDPSALSSLAPASDLPSGWNYAGCSVDNLNPRSLPLAFYRDSSGMTGETCIAFCNSKGYNVAGVEYSSECYCGTALPSLAQESDCSMACSGNSAEACGGPARLTVYNNVVQGAPEVNPGVDGWISYGCVADSVQSRTLPDGVQVQGEMTVAKCVSACQEANYAFAGVEYAQECFCGNSASLQPTNDPAQCYMPCAGNHSEYCGGPNALNVYAAPPVTPPPGDGCLPLRADGYGLLQNGGFESGFDGWVASIIQGTFAPSLDTEHQFEGCDAALVTPSSDPAASIRQISISQTVSGLTPGASYTFTGYQGRLPDSLNDPSPVIAVNIGSQRLGQITACAGTLGCDIERGDGARYTEHVVPFTYECQGGTAVLQFVVTWTSEDQQSGNPPLLFDGFNLVQSS